jgi:hypothetical protein
VARHVRIRGAAQQAALTAADITKIKADVTAAIDNYYKLFTELKQKSLADESFFIPWILLGGNGPQANETKEKAIAGWEASAKQLVESGWGKSVFTTENVCVLNASAAIASGYNTRYKKDGSVMSVGGVSYILGKTPAGWRIISYTGTPKGKIVRCD